MENKIVFLSEYFPVNERDIRGGVENRLFYFVKKLSKKHKIIVITSRQSKQKKYIKRGNIEIYRTGIINPYSNNGNLIKKLLWSISSVSKGISLKNVKFVQGESFLSYLPTYVISKWQKVPRYITYHETWIGDWIKNKGIVTGIFGELWERLVLLIEWDHIFAVSKFTEKKLKRLHSKSDISVLYNFIDLNEFKGSIRKYNSKTFVTFSRLSPTKNIDIIIKSMVDYPNNNLRIIGSGPEENNLKKLVNQLNLKNVKFLGRINSRSKMISELKKCHIFVSASSVEGFGISVIEALACGLRCVISNIPPYREITKGSRNVRLSRNFKKVLGEELNKNYINERHLNKFNLDEVLNKWEYFTIK